MPDVQQLMVALEKAKTQRIQNEAVRNALYEAEEYIQRLHANTFTERMRLDLNDAHAAALKCLDDFEVQFSCNNLRRPKDDFQTAASINPGIEKGLRGMRECLGILQSLPQSETVERSIEEMTRCVERALGKASDTSVDTSRWVGTLRAVLDTVREALTVPTTHQQIKILDDEAMSIQAQISSVVVDQEKHLQEGNVMAATEGYEEIIGLSESLVGVLQDELKTLKGVQRTVVDTAALNTNALESMCNKDIFKFVKTNAEQKKKLEETLQGIFVNSKDSWTTRHTAEQQHLIEFESVHRQLFENAWAQEYEWIVMQRAEASLHRLGQERNVTVCKWMRSCEREAKRHADANILSTEVSSDIVAAQASLRSCSHVQEVSELLECTCETALKILREFVQSTTLQIKEITNKVHANYLTAYRTLRLTLGDVIHKKQSKADEIAAKVAAATAQQEICIDTYNPLAKKYTMERASLISEWDALRQEIQYLNTKVEKHHNLFIPSEQALITAGKQFEDIEVEAARKDAERRGRIAEFNEMDYQRYCVEVDPNHVKKDGSVQKVPRRITM